MAECQTLTPSPSRARSRDSSCGVRAISGTRTIEPAAARPGLGHGAQVDLGLARAGHPVQQQPPAVVHRRDGRRERLGLVAGEGGRLVALGRAAADRLEGPGRGRARLEAKDPVRGHPPQRRHGGAGRPAQVGGGHRCRRRRRAPRPRRGGGRCRGPAPPAARTAVRRGAAPVGGAASTPLAIRAAAAAPRRRPAAAPASGRRRPARGSSGRSRARGPAARAAPAAASTTPASGARRPSWVAGAAAGDDAQRRAGGPSGQATSAPGAAAASSARRDRVVEDAVQGARLDERVDLGGGAPLPVLRPRRRRDRCAGGGRGPAPLGALGQPPAASRPMSVASQVKSGSVRPKCP